MAKATVLHWGILGTARINRALIGPIQASKKSHLMAIASRDPTRAAEYAKNWKIPRFHTSYTSLLEDEDIDVIYNSLPNSLHAEWSIKAMQMGKHVLCEKPLTTSMEDFEQLKNTAIQTGRVICEAFMYRHHPQTLRIKEMVDNGEIGQVQLINGAFCYMNIRPDDPRFDPDLDGGSLWDVGCYPIGYSRFITGEEPVQVYGQQVIGLTGVDVLFAGQMRFPNGTIALFESSFISPSRWIMEITGSKGRITVPMPYKPVKNEKIYIERDGHSDTIPIRGAELYQGEVEDIENAILDGKPTRISLEESRGNLKTILAFYTSARQFKLISL